MWRDIRLMWHCFYSFSLLYLEMTIPHRLLNLKFVWRKCPWWIRIDVSIVKIFTYPIICVAKNVNPIKSDPNYKIINNKWLWFRKSHSYRCKKSFLIVLKGSWWCFNLGPKFKIKLYMLCFRSNIVVFCILYKTCV